MRKGLDPDIRNRFDELIREGSELVSNLDEYSADHYCRYEALIVKSCGLIQFVLGESESSREYQSRIEARPVLGQVSGQPTWYLTAGPILRIVAILTGLLDNYVNGFLNRLQELVAAEITADYLHQAELFLDDPNVRSDGYGRHVPAAVVAGAVLEDALRRLCVRQTPPLETKKDNGQPKRLNALIDELQNAGLYNPMKGDHLRSWAKIRNHAGHGEYSEFSRHDVESMLRDMKVFLGDYL